MQTVRSAAAASVGARLLGEIDETTLDEVLASLRTTFATTTTNDGNDIPAGHARLPTFPIAPLNDLVTRHFRTTQSAPLGLTGRHCELLYLLVATLISPPHDKAVSIIDFEGRFDPLRLLSTCPVESERGASTTSTTVRYADLDHVHILRPARGSPAHIADCVASMEEYMLYGSHRSRSREWWGTIVIGGGLNPAGSSIASSSSAQVAVTADWKGWLRVDRAEVPTFWDMSVEEALGDREKRMAAVEEAEWVASSAWGGLVIGRRGR